MHQKVWGDTDNSVVYNTPVLKDGLLLGLSNRSQIFCINTETQETVWRVSPAGKAVAEGPGQGRRSRGGRGGGNGSIVDAGSVMIALPASAPLVFFEPTAEFTMLASYNVSTSGTYAYPVVAGNRIFIKDQVAVTLWTLNG